MNLYHSKLGKTLGIDKEGRCFVITTFQYKRGLKNKIKEINNSIDALHELRRTLQTHIHNKLWNSLEKESYLMYADGIFIQWAIDHWQKQVDELNREYNLVGTDKKMNTDNYKHDVERAKQRPITNFVKFKGGFALCLWHKERSPSMKYYPKSNRVHCFGGCGKDEDVIGVVQQLMGVGFVTAVGIINK